MNILKGTLNIFVKLVQMLISWRFFYSKCVMNNMMELNKGEVNYREYYIEKEEDNYCESHKKIKKL